MWFGKKKKTVREYDRRVYEPVLRRSICTGETTAGLRNLKNGSFREVMLIRDENDLEEFKEMYGVTGDLKTVF